jgi:ribonuclease-3
VSAQSPEPDATGEPAEAVAELSARLGLEFRDPGLLALALVHPSLVNEAGLDRTISNQRLEFLGDAVIGLVVAETLYRKHPDWTEGRLTVARSTLVSGDTLAAVAEEIGLGATLVMGKGEESGGGSGRPTNLAAALEALIGATLLDGGHEVASALTLRLLGDRLDAADGETGPNAKTALQELVQGRELAAPIYHIVSQSGDPHEMSFTAEVEVDGKVAGSGTGPRKSAAEQAAASAALAALARLI